MLFISSGLETSILKADATMNLSEFVNKKLFRVADTSLTYRQVNKLSEDNLLNEERKTKNGWRKFSIKELVFMETISEVKKYGLEHKNLKELWECFFKEQSTQSGSKNISEFRDKHIAETAISCVLRQVEMTLTINNSGNVAIFDPISYLFFGSNSHIKIQLNKIVNDLLVKIGQAPLPPEHTLQTLLSKQTTIREKELLKILRNNDYKAIRVKKKNGEISTVHAEKIIDKDAGLSDKDLILHLKNKDFQDLTISKRDGEIVHFKVEETHKL